MTSISSFIILLDFALIIFIVAILVIGKVKPRTYYLAAIFVISLNLLLITQFTTPHIIGTDVHLEKYLIDQTITSRKWDPTYPATNTNTLLSTTIFPAVTCEVSHLSSEWFLKYVMSFIYAFMPIILFLVYERIFKELGEISHNLGENSLRLSFAAALVYIFNFTFLMGPSNSRLIPAFLGMALAVYVLVNKDFSNLARHFIFLLSSFLVFVSHYTASSFWILSVVGYIVVLIIWHNRIANNINSKRAPLITVNTIMLLFTVYICWYFFVSSTFGESFVKVPINIFENLGQLFNPAAYSSEMVETVTGRGLEPGMSMLFMKIIGNSIRLSIVIGFLSAIFYFYIKRKKINMSWELLSYFAFSAFSFLIIGLAFLPKLTIYYDIQRIYLQSLILLSIFFPVGIYFIVKGLLELSKKMRSSNAPVFTMAMSVALLLLVGQFLSQTGTIFYLSGNSCSIYYSDPVKHGHIILDQEVTSAHWLASHRNAQPITYVKIMGGNQLIGYGHIWLDRIQMRGNFDSKLLHGLVYIHRFFYFHASPSELSNVYQHNQLYDSGLTKIYYLH